MKSANAALEMKDLKLTIERLEQATKAPDEKIRLQTRFESQIAEFKALRFAKSNNNPQSNFKKKADLHATLSTAVDNAVDQAPKSLKAGALVWGNIVHAELLIDFADTLENAALPAV